MKEKQSCARHAGVHVLWGNQSDSFEGDLRDLREKFFSSVRLFWAILCHTPPPGVFFSSHRRCNVASPTITLPSPFSLIDPLRGRRGEAGASP